MANRDDAPGGSGEERWVRDGFAPARARHEPTHTARKDDTSIKCDDCWASPGERCRIRGVADEGFAERSTRWRDRYETAARALEEQPTQGPGRDDTNQKDRSAEGPIHPMDREQMWGKFGAAVRLARKGTGFTMGEVARRLGVPVAVVSALETGDTDQEGPL